MQEIILIDDEFFIELIKDIDLAKNFIDMETYIFTESQLGDDITNAFIKAAERGVKVRLLLDGVGTFHWKNLQNKMNVDGIEVKAYHPMFWSTFRWSKKRESIQNILHYITHVNSRNHRKTCVIDNKIAYIGSANITEFSNRYKKNDQWHDVTVKLVGLPLDELRFAYNNAWKCLLFKNKLNSFLKLENKVDNHVLLNYSWRKRRKLYKLFLIKLDQASQRIWIVNAYFVPRNYLLSKIIKATTRGILVTIILPNNSDVLGMSLLMKSFYYQLLKSGVKIVHHGVGILHTKFLIVDDWFCVGSINFNYRSFHYDLEADIVLQTPEAKEKLEWQFRQYCKESEEVTLKSMDELTFLEKIGMKFLWIFRYLF